MYASVFPPFTKPKMKYIVHVFMRDEKEGRKKQAKSNKQQGKATQHTQGSHFSLHLSCLGWDSNPQHYTLDRALYHLYMNKCIGKFINRFSTPSLQMEHACLPDLHTM